MLKGICIRREFNVWAADKSSPIVDWLRALARKAHAECGGKGVGAVGMCFTGGFALAMMTEPAVVAPVLSQPSLPLPLARARGADRRLAGRDRLRQAPLRDRRPVDDRPALQQRPWCPTRASTTYKREFGDRFEAIEIDAKDAQPARHGARTRC